MIFQKKTKQNQQEAKQATFFFKKSHQDQKVSGLSLGDYSQEGRADKAKTEKQGVTGGAPWPKVAQETTRVIVLLKAFWVGITICTLRDELTF